MESKSKFSPSEKQGFSIKNGLLYEFKKESVNVSRPWPPCKYTKTKDKPFWHYSPTHKISLHYTALKYSVEIEKGVLELGSAEVLECESSKVAKFSDVNLLMTDKSSLNGLNVERFQRLSDESRMLIEDAFWARYALPAVGIQIIHIGRNPWKNNGNGHLSQLVSMTRSL
jgi:hypothetical protein